MTYSSRDGGITLPLNFPDEETTVLSDRMRATLQADDASLPQATRTVYSLPQTTTPPRLSPAMSPFPLRHVRRSFDGREDHLAFQREACWRSRFVAFTKFIVSFCFVLRWCRGPMSVSDESLLA